MSVYLDPDGSVVNIEANYKDAGCDEINFVQFWRHHGDTEWDDDWGKGQNRTPNPPFYVPHGSPGVHDGYSPGDSIMTDTPGGLAGIDFEYITCAVCASGESRLRVYGCVRWRVQAGCAFGRHYNIGSWREISQDEWAKSVPRLPRPRLLRRNVGV